MTVQLKLIALDHCPVCLGTRSNKLFSLGDIVVFHCPTCNFKYLNPCLSPSSMSEIYNSEKELMSLHSCHEGYYEYGDPTAKNQTTWEFSTAMDRVQQQLSGVPQPAVLDVGFGNGLFLSMAAKRGWGVDGIDSGKDNVERARSKFGLQLTQASFETYNGKENQFDVVSFWDVIEHLPDPHSALKKAHRLLKPNGVLLIGIPNDTSLMAWIAKSIYKLSLGTVKKPAKSLYFFEHVGYYNLGALKRLLESNQYALADHFYSRTDVEKYSFTALKKLIAVIILQLGRCVGMENRLVVIAQKKATVSS